MKIKFSAIFAAIMVALGWRANAQTYDTNNDVVQTFAGSQIPGYLDGQGQSTEFSSPGSIVADTAGNLYVWDSGNSRIREITTNAMVSTLAGGGGGGSGTPLSSGTNTTVRLDSGGTNHVDVTSIPGNIVSGAVPVAVTASNAPDGGPIASWGNATNIANGVYSNNPAGYLTMASTGVASATVATNAPTGPPLNDGVVSLEQFGGQTGTLLRGIVTCTSGSPTISCASANFTGCLSNVVYLEQDPTNSYTNTIFAVITNVVSSTSVKINTNAWFSVSTASLYYGTNNVQAYQSAIDYCNFTNRAFDIIQARNGIYIFGAMPGGLNTNYNEYSLIHWPTNATANDRALTTIVTRSPSGYGNIGVNGAFDYSSPTNGTVFFFSGTPADTNGYSCFIGGNSVNSFSGPSPVWQGINFVQPINPAMTCLNFRYGASPQIFNSTLYADWPHGGPGYVQNMVSTNNTSYGVIFPQTGNNGNNLFFNSWVIGYGTGLWTAQHTVLIGGEASANQTGVYADQSDLTSYSFNLVGNIHYNLRFYTNAPVQIYGSIWFERDNGLPTLDMSIGAGNPPSYTGSIVALNSQPVTDFPLGNSYITIIPTAGNTNVYGGGLFNNLTVPSHGNGGISDASHPILIGGPISYQDTKPQLTMDSLYGVWYELLGASATRWDVEFANVVEICMDQYNQNSAMGTLGVSNLWANGSVISKGGTFILYSNFAPAAVSGADARWNSNNVSEWSITPGSTNKLFNY